MTWEFIKTYGKNKVTMITVELEADGLGAIADDDYYNGTLTREEALDLAQAILEKFAPEAFARLTDPARNQP